MSVEASYENVAHLLRRAAFGATVEEVAAYQELGIEGSVDALLNFSASAPDDPPPGLATAYEQIELMGPWHTDVLERWWLDRMLTSPTPALEKLTLFWHGHFATSNWKVGSDDLMWRQNAMLRSHGTGNFRDLAQAVSRDPAMLLFLDTAVSVVDAPNENYARELMELFCLGRNNGYTEHDVREAARAFTGWTVDWSWLGGDATYDYVFWEQGHDSGEKTVLGHTGPWDGGDVVDIVVGLPEAAAHVVGAVWGRYAARSAPTEVLADLTRTFASSLDVTELLRALFTHPGFYAPEVQRALVSTPVELAIRTMRVFGLTTAEMDWVIYHLASMGQTLFAPPNVAGWGANRYWTSAGGSSARAFFASDLAWVVTTRAIEGGPGSQLLDLTADPAALAGAVYTQLGIPDPSARSLAHVAAVAAQVGAGDPMTTLWAALTLAVISPEIQLA